MSCVLPLASAQRALPSQTNTQIDLWIGAQQRLIEHWIDQVVADNGSAQLLAILEQHRHFLGEARSMVLNG